MYENVSQQTLQVDTYLLWSSAMLVYKWHLSGCSTEASGLSAAFQPHPPLLGASEWEAASGSKESPWFCRNLRLNGGGLGSKDSWNSSLRKQGGTEVSCLEISRQRGAFPSFRPNHLPESSSGKNFQAERECEADPWGPQHQCEALEITWNCLTQ